MKVHHTLPLIACLLLSPIAAQAEDVIDEITMDVIDLDSADSETIVSEIELPEGAELKLRERVNEENGKGEMVRTRNEAEESELQVRTQMQEMRMEQNRMMQQQMQQDMNGGTGMTGGMGGNMPR